MQVNTHYAAASQFDHPSSKCVNDPRHHKQTSKQQLSGIAKFVFSDKIIPQIIMIPVIF